ncbi:hypothetical protein SAMN05421805_102364 [Saccharopolyspora antimicrobica]|uniref:Uncharacterized protein n=1 Tax=Saccharopolyspora antimicrobica TaxID=455193 RepID=A0A1I4VSM8_9PSEU|nr:hypothetical protein [Saccharopolyspora antimicrobica]SFN04308.1 hypothetical protein SAMN05421805_102364 [Saccharopolyspora antimicrobica]
MLTENPGDDFTHRSEGTQSCRIEATESVPGDPDSRVVMNSYFTFTDDKPEWKGTTISFDV